MTEEIGVIEVVAKGARKSGSRLAGVSEPLTATVFGIAKGKKQHYVTQSQPATAFPGLRLDYERLSYGLSLAELANLSLPHGQPSPDGFALLLNSLRYLEVHPKPLVAYIWSQIKLLELIGFAPRLTQCIVTGQRVKEANPFVSAYGGGYVNSEDRARFRDAKQTQAEVLYGLAALIQLDAPPDHLKFARESAKLLMDFWQAVVERPLPATKAANQLLNQVQV